MNQLNFTHDTDLTLRAVCVLVNTLWTVGPEDERERLGDQTSLDAYLDRFGWTGRRDRDEQELTAVHQLRTRLTGLCRLIELPDAEERVVEAVNALLRDTQAMPWLTRHPEMPDWHLHLASTDDPLAQRMGAEMAMALADLIRLGELRRLKICAAPDCASVLIDMSRNRSRMFCDTGNCGNRQHVAAYRERRAKAVDG